MCDPSATDEFAQVLFGSGLRFSRDSSLELEKIDVREVGARTSLRFRVRK